MLSLTLIILPVICGLMVLAFKSDIAKYVALAAAVAELAVVLVAFSGFATNADVQYAFTMPWMPEWGITFSLGMDGISMMMVFLAALLMPSIILSAFNSDKKYPAVFYALMLLMQSGLMGVFLAQDGFVFYFFWEIALIPIYFLASIWGSERKIPVTTKFFIYTIFGSLFMLLSILYLYLNTGENPSSALTDLYAAGRNLDHLEQTYVFLGLFAAFAIKMPLFPFHTWQPDTYTEAPTPATMLLSGIMLKMGVYGLIRWLLPVVPWAVNEWTPIVIVLSVIGIIYGSIIAIRQRDIKKLVAYSSFAHVGLMGAAIFSLEIEGLQGAIIQMVAHGINVVGLFHAVQIIRTRVGRTLDISDFGGITQSSPSLTVYFMLVLLGSVALPLTNGFPGEFLMLKGVFMYNPILGVVAGLTIILGAVYMLRLFQSTMFGPKTEHTQNFAKLTFSEGLAFFPLASLVLLMGFFPNIFLSITEPAAKALLTDVVSAVSNSLTLKP